jgi:NAD(P)-dependent dehydrogenase (short-subunit alcohol dehydrogenase family)
MQNLEDQSVVVTGGTRGLGLGIVEALVARRAKVTVVARDRARLAEVERRLGAATIAGDVTEPRLAAAVLREVKPTVVILNAGATPEGREVLAVFRDRRRPRPDYFVDVAFVAGAIASIRDFRYVPYIADEATFALAGAP